MNRAKSLGLIILPFLFLASTRTRKVFEYICATQSTRPALGNCILYRFERSMIHGIICQILVFNVYMKEKRDCENLVIELSSLWGSGVRNVTRGNVTTTLTTTHDGDDNDNDDLKNVELNRRCSKYRAFHRDWEPIPLLLLSFSLVLVKENTCVCASPIYLRLILW